MQIEIEIISVVITILEVLCFMSVNVRLTRQMGESCKFILLFITFISFNCAFRFGYFYKHLLH